MVSPPILRGQERRSFSKGVETGSDVALAFGLVIAAGLSTTVGACIAFCTNVANTRTLAIALGASAGVML